MQPVVLLQYVNRVATIVDNTSTCSYMGGGEGSKNSVSNNAFLIIITRRTFVMCDVPVKTSKEVLGVTTPLLADVAD